MCIRDRPRGGNYHWIDNHLVRATRYNGKFTNLIEKTVKIEVFDDDFNHDSLVDDKNLDGYVREYLKTIQDTSTLKKEMERLR